MRAEADHMTIPTETSEQPAVPTPAPPAPAPPEDADDEPRTRPARRGDGESRYSRQSAKLPRIGEGAGSVLSSMAGLRKGSHVEEDDDQD